MSFLNSWSQVSFFMVFIGVILLFVALGAYTEIIAGRVKYRLVLPISLLLSAIMLCAGTFSGFQEYRVRKAFDKVVHNIDVTKLNLIVNGQEVESGMEIMNELSQIETSETSKSNSQSDFVLVFESDGNSQHMILQQMSHKKAYFRVWWQRQGRMTKIGRLESTNMLQLLAPHSTGEPGRDAREIQGFE